MSDRGTPKKKNEGFNNNPFKSALTDLKKKQAEPAKKAQAPAPPPKPTKSKRASEEDDTALFLSAMDGVMQVTDRGEPPPVVNPRLPELLDENAEALAELAEMVAGQGDFAFADAHDVIEGAAPGVDGRLMRSLRRGDFSRQAQLDLHGMTQTQARDAVERFLSENRRAGKRCVLIIHGRGLNSVDQLPVLKESLRGWLSQKRVGRQVLAFSSARPQDGGTGAVYVLLRR